MGFKRFLKVLGLVVVIATVTRCAQPGSPGGGPKDTSPPEVLATSPPNVSPNFSGDKFTIYFDEFVELDNIIQKALISPPMDKLPDFKLKGKSLQVKFNEELKENTTYSVYFGDAIVDLSEKNPLLNYTYIFSTGPKVDSMSLKGQVINAFDLVPVENVFVMLYKDNNDTLPLDSLPLAVKPFYLSKSDVNGKFQLNGLANEKYLMFAIADLNGNYFFDQPSEQIAFLDSLVTPQYETPPAIDSTIIDSLWLFYEEFEEDSIQALVDALYLDSIKSNRFQISNHILSLFTETDTTQMLLKAELLRRNSLRFSFSKPAVNVRIEPVNFNPDTLWYEEEFSKNKDTITWFLKTLPLDTLEMFFFYNLDTLGHEFLRINPNRPAPGGETRKEMKEKEGKIEYLGFETNLSRGILPLNKQPAITFYQPLQTILSDSILFVSGEDSIYNPKYVIADSLKRKIVFPVELQESMKYSIQLPDSSFIGWNGYYNESKKINFSTKSLKDYGVFILSLVPEIKQSYILQLTTDKEELIREFYFNSDTTYRIEYLDPGKYALKLIYDSNSNRKWDSGNYFEKLQPEKVFYFPKTIEVRGNWEIEEVWEFDD
jgi:hypothetical protein